MSQLKVDIITDEEGTGSPEFPNGAEITGGVIQGVSGSFNFDSGSAASPSITFDGDTNTGLFRPAADTLAAATNGSERMRMLPSGDVLIGTTAGIGFGFKCNILGNFSVLGLRSLNSGSLNIGSYNSAGNLSFSVANNGNVTNTNNSYGAISDAKLKENIVDSSPKLDKLTQVRVVNYNLKINPDQKLLGVIAQELEQIFPGMVEETAGKDMEGNDLGTTTKSVKYSVFVPMLIKAMQEQQAMIESLEQRIQALEGKE